MKRKVEQRYLEAQKRIDCIRKFAKDMEYEVFEQDYIHCYNNRPCHSIELMGTSDSEGNSYSWAWHTDTWEEFV